MKSKCVVSVLILFTILVVSSSYIQAQDLTFSTGADVVNRYIWRGMDVNDQPNIQPNITIKYSGLQMGFWGSYGLSHLNSTDEHYTFSHEIDTWLSYSFSLNKSVNVTALLTDYYYPNGGVKIGNFNNYDNKNGAGAHTIEAGLIIAGQESFPLSLSGYVNIHNDKGHNIYLQGDYSAVFQDVSFGLFVGAAAGSKDAPDYYGTASFNIVHMGVKISKSVKVSENFSLPVYCSYILNPNREIAFLVLGISL